MESEVILTEFTAAIDTRIVSDNGAKCMIFEAGQTLKVHKDLWPAAMRAGLVPKNPDEMAEKPEGPKEPAIKPGKSKEEAIREGLIEACKQLIARGDTKDFTVLGLPRTASVKKLVDFDFKARDVQEAFEQAMFEVEQNGDESTELAESSSGDTE